MMPGTNAISVVVFPDSHEAEAHGFNYNEWDKRPTPVNATKAVVVQRGTVEGRATVDFITEDASGTKHVFMVTARLLEQIVAVANSHRSGT